MRCVVAIPVGPGPGEAASARDLLASLAAWEPTAGPIVVVDDEPPRVFPGATEVVANPRRGRGLGAMGPTCTATLTALRWAHAVAPGAPVLRLDADALVIAPFATRLACAFAAHPEAGVHGVCDRTPGGAARDPSSWAPLVAKHARALTLWRDGRPHVALTPEVARTVRAARRAGHEPGRHCIAGACAISAAMVAAMAADGMLDDTLRWVGTRLGDDVMLGLQAAALGFALRDEPGLFGVAHRGLPDVAQRLAERGFAFVHSVRGEDAARAWFAAQRPAT